MKEQYNNFFLILLLHLICHCRNWVTCAAAFSIPVRQIKNQPSTFLTKENTRKIIHHSYFARSSGIPTTSSSSSSTRIDMKQDDKTTMTVQASSTALSTSNRIQTTLDPCVVLMKQLISKHSPLWDEKGGIYSLAQGVVYWEPPPSTYQELSKAIGMNNASEGDIAPEISNDLHQYCPDEGLPSLIQALKQKLERENNLPNDDSTQIIITSGANQAYMNCVLSLLSENDNVKESCIVFKPYYFNHVMAVQMTRGEEALVVGPVDDNGMPCVDWLRQTLVSSSSSPPSSRKVKMVTITNPGNPTGVSLPKEKLQEIVDLCKEFGVWVVMDNTYEHFDHEKVNCFPISSNNDDEEEEFGFNCFQDENVIHIFSFSKGYAMAGFRVGYVVMNASGEKGKDVYQQALKVQDTIPICTSRLSQLAALGALSAGRKWVSNKVSTLSQSREAIIKALQPLEIIGGNGAMYVMAKLPDGIEDDVKVGEILVEKYGIAIIPGSFCGYPGWIRVCYSNLKPADCLIAADRLSDGIADILSGEVTIA